MKVPGGDIKLETKSPQGTLGRMQLKCNGHRGNPVDGASVRALNFGEIPPKKIAGGCREYT